MFCQNCGNKIDSDSKFCQNCGMRIEIDKSPNVNNPTKTTEQGTVDIVEKSVSEKSNKGNDDKEWSEKTMGEKIETVYDSIFGIILIIWGFTCRGEIVSAWKDADSKIAFIVHSFDYLYTLCIWYVPLCIIEAIYFLVKGKVRKALYQSLSVSYVQWLPLLFLVV